MTLFEKICLNTFLLFHPYKFYGKENIPEGACVIVCNHFQWSDCGFIAKAYPKDIYFLAKKEIFKNKILAKIVKSFGGIPIDRENPELKSMLESLRVLKNGHKLTIFPEGTRNITGTNELQPTKTGSAIFAVKAKCPIVPMMFYKKSKIFKRTHLIIGKPFELSEFYDKRDFTKEELDAMNEKMREKMINELENLKVILEKKKKNRS